MPLFYPNNIHNVLVGQLDRLKSEISGTSDGEITQNSDVELEKYFINKFGLEVPVLIKDQIEVEQKDKVVEVRQDRYNAFGREQPSVERVAIVTVPFTGDRNFFQIRPSSFDLTGENAYEAIHETDHLVLNYVLREDTKAQIQSDISRIENYLQRLRDDIKGFNTDLTSIIREAVTARRTAIAKNNDLLGGLGFKVKERPNSPKTYIVPNVRPKAMPVFPKNTSSDPDPTLDSGIYEKILSVITDMVKVIERSPSSFVQMKEEDLRQHFLVQLNGHFEGEATGETFNSKGKTDILIRHKGENLFIGECKYWDGEKSLEEALNQILKYTTWRDTKTAIIIFNRNKNLTDVLNKIDNYMKSRPELARSVTGAKTETSFRYILKHAQDAERELVVSILVFDMPIK